AIDVFMSSCTVFVFFSLMEYALVNVVLGDVPEEYKKTRPRTLMHLPNKQDSESPKKECLGGGRSEFEASPGRSAKLERPMASPSAAMMASHRRSPAVERRPNGRKALCQTELEAITTITSPLASPANGLSPLEMMAASSCPAHLSPAPHITTTHMVNGPVFHHGMQHATQHSTIQHSHATQHSTIQHSVNFGLPPPPPPPPIGNVKANQGHTRRRERAILIDRVSRILFPTSFTVLNVIYWSVFVVKWF
uniref:gamma-aminobutyric acid receptor subunit alpha-4-like n=1 Tax=Penaeus japonicus TaxID=27405 RepID=UPI001C70D773